MSHVAYAHRLVTHLVQLRLRCLPLPLLLPLLMPWYSSMPGAVGVVAAAVFAAAAAAGAAVAP
eukprot:3201827-Amphidinium_carterae.1